MNQSKPKHRLHISDAPEKFFNERKKKFFNINVSLRDSNGKIVRDQHIQFILKLIFEDYTEDPELQQYFQVNKIQTIDRVGVKFCQGRINTCSYKYGNRKFRIKAESIKGNVEPGVSEPIYVMTKDPSHRSSHRSSLGGKKRLSSTNIEENNRTIRARCTNGKSTSIRFYIAT
jgi:hypothetical protein